MKKTIIFFFLVLLCPGIKTQSIAQWTFENITSAVPSTPIEASSHSWRVNSAYASISGGNNNGSPDACSGAESWSTNFWPTGSSIGYGDYLEFYATAKFGYDLIVNSFSFNTNISSINGARKFEVYYSTDGFNLNSEYLGSGSNSTGFCSGESFNLDVQTPSGGTITFRIYPYDQNPAAQAASMRLDNVTIWGEALLPITLVEWTAKIREGGIWLSWVTANEHNNAYFAIERRTDHTDFEEIDRLAGQVNSQERLEYSFYDIFPASGANYYRLKQVDVDQSINYSDVIAVNFQPPADIRVFPTVVQSKLSVDFGKKEGTRSQISISNMSGHRLMHQTFTPEHRQCQIDVGGLDRGMYFVMVETGRERIIRRFVKH